VLVPKVIRNDSRYITEEQARAARAAQAQVGGAANA
jgi:hypothetical protein